MKIKRNEQEFNMGTKSGLFIIHAIFILFLSAPLALAQGQGQNPEERSHAAQKAEGGHGGGNGGDADLLEAAARFLEVAKEVDEDLAGWAAEHFDDGFGETIRARYSDLNHRILKLVPQHGPVDGKDARNYPGEGVRFDADAFEKITDNLKRKAFVCHELAGLAEVEVNEYSGSGKYLSLLRQREVARRLHREEIYRKALSDCADDPYICAILPLVPLEVIEKVDAIKRRKSK